MFPKVVWRKKLRSFDTSNIMTFCQIIEVASRVRQKVVDHRSLTIEKCLVQEKKSLETKGRWWQGRWWQDLLYHRALESNTLLISYPLATYNKMNLKNYSFYLLLFIVLFLKLSRLWKYHAVYVLLSETKLFLSDNDYFFYFSGYFVLIH